MLLHHHLSIIIYHLYHLYYTMFNYILYYTLCKRTRQGRPLRCSQSHFNIIGCHSFDGIHWFSPCHLIIIVNIVITTIYWLGLLDLINERGERQTQVWHQFVVRLLTRPPRTEGFDWKMTGVMESVSKTQLFSGATTRCIGCWEEVAWINGWVSGRQILWKFCCCRTSLI